VRATCAQTLRRDASLQHTPLTRVLDARRFGKGKHAEAVEKYTQAIDLWMDEKDRAVLYSNRSAARLKLAGEKQKALADADRAVQLAPGYAKAHFRRGQALRALGDPAASAEAMAKVLEIEPGDGAAAVALAELHAALDTTSAASSKSANSKAGSGLTGAFAAGHVVAPSSAAAAAKPFAKLTPKASEFAAAAPQLVPMPSVVPKDGEIIVSRSDYPKVEPAAQSFYDAHEAAVESHAKLQPPPKPKTKAEEMFPGMAFPPGFGPDEPDWDGSYTPIDQLPSYEAAKKKADAEAAAAAAATPPAVSAADAAAVAQVAADLQAMPESAKERAWHPSWDAEFGAPPPRDPLEGREGWDPWVGETNWHPATHNPRGGKK
jgi:hypothetical protein